MLIYLEKSLAENKKAKEIIAHYSSSKVLLIDNYKNIFDKKVAGSPEKAIVIACLNNALSEIPENYGFPGKWFFLKNSLNCVYDCRYCYLKWALKNNHIQVFFINYEDIKNQILSLMEKKKEEEKPIWFYSSDYSDNLATDTISWFCESFIPFFEQLPNAKMEVRTKSANIQHLLSISPPKNTEIAFSLSPESVIQKYETLTPSLDMRIKALNTLLEKGWKVWVRLLPLLPIENYREVYGEFFEFINKKIDFSRVHSFFTWGLLYTYEDYKKILKKEKMLDILYRLEKNEDGFYREKRSLRDDFYAMIWEKLSFKNCFLCLDSKDEEK